LKESRKEGAHEPIVFLLTHSDTSTLPFLAPKRTPHANTIRAVKERENTKKGVGTICDLNVIDMHPRRRKSKRREIKPG